MDQKLKFDMMIYDRARDSDKSVTVTAHVKEDGSVEILKIERETIESALGLAGLEEDEDPDDSLIEEAKKATLREVRRGDR